MLVPVKTGQKKAVIRIFVNRNGEHILLSEIPVNLEDCVSPDPRISVSGKISGRKLVLSVSVEEKDIPAEPIPVGRYLKRNLKLPLLITSAVLLAALLILTLIKLLPEVRDSSTPPTPAPAENTAEVQKKEEVLPTAGKPAEVKPAEGKEEERETQAAEKPAPQEQQPPAAEPEIKITEATVYFYPNSSDLKEGELLKLDKVADYLIRHPEKKVIIEGHCAMYGTREGRLKVSRARAEKIRDYLVLKGWKSTEPLQIKWYGASRPVTTDPAQKDRNRRVEIKIQD